MKPIAIARGGGRLGCALFGIGRALPAQRTLRMSFLNMQSASKIFRLLNRAALPKAPQKDPSFASGCQGRASNGARDPRSVAPKPPFTQGFNRETSQFEA